MVPLFGLQGFPCNPKRFFIRRLYRGLYGEGLVTFRFVWQVIGCAVQRNWAQCAVGLMAQRARAAHTLRSAVYSSYTEYTL